MNIGDVVKMSDRNYLIVNTNGTMEKLPEIKWYLNFYFKLRQGFGIKNKIANVRKLALKHKKTS